MIKNSIRCCLSCILPCGALDVIRIVHSNGRVEEIAGTGTVKARDVMKAHPKHVLKKPSSPSSSSVSQHYGAGVGGGCVPNIVIVPPDAQLQRGKIYFLMPLPHTPQTQEKKIKNMQRRKKMRKGHSERSRNGSLVVSNDGYLNDILSEKVSTQRDRRRGRVAVWRPHLESISESPSSCDL